MTEEEKRVERGKQEFHIGDRVKVYEMDGSLKYGGRTGIIIEKAKLSPKCLYYGLYINNVTDVKKDNRGEICGDTAFFAPFFAEDLELVNPYKDVRRAEETTPERHTITIPVNAEIDATYWTAYRAEIAKEIATKVTNEKSVKDTKIAEYAVDFATKVTEGLVKTQNTFENMVHSYCDKAGIIVSKDSGCKFKVVKNENEIAEKAAPTGAEGEVQD